jgi:hypothetical protein
VPSELIATDFPKPAEDAAGHQLRFDETDYSVVVKNRAPPPSPWRWEIYRAGRSSAIRQSPVFFQTMVAANKAGKAALRQLVDTLTP